MLKEIDGKIVVPIRFMEWLEEVDSFDDNSKRIALINRCGWRFELGINLCFDDETYTDLTYFANDNKVQLTRALLDKKEFISEEEIKYYMVAPKGFSEIDKYLNLDADENKYYTSTRTNTNSSKTQFTQSEIDAMPQKYRDFFTQVEVEE